MNWMKYYMYGLIFQSVYYLFERYFSQLLYFDRFWFEDLMNYWLANICFSLKFTMLLDCFFSENFTCNITQGNLFDVRTINADIYYETYISWHLNTKSSCSSYEISGVRWIAEWVLSEKNWNYTVSGVQRKLVNSYLTGHSENSLKVFISIFLITCYINNS